MVCRGDSIWDCLEPCSHILLPLTRSTVYGTSCWRTAPRTARWSRPQSLSTQSSRPSSSASSRCVLICCSRARNILFARCGYVLPSYSKWPPHAFVGRHFRLTLYILVTPRRTRSPLPARRSPSGAVSLSAVICAVTKPLHAAVVHAHFWPLVNLR